MSKIQKILKDETSKYIKEIRPKIKDILENSVLSLMGLEKNYQNKYEIDHCNGRNSVLIDVFRNIAIGEAKKIASNYKPSKDDIINFQKAFESEYKNQMHYAINDAVKLKTKNDVQLFMEKIKIDIESLLDNEKKD